MRKPTERRAQRGLPKAESTSISAPVGGWNSRDPEATMRPEDALWLENWQPNTGSVSVRKGVVLQASGIAGSVESLIGYNAPTSKKLFAVSTGGVYDVSVEGAVGAPLLAVTNPRFIAAQSSVLGGTYLCMVNGVDKLLQYNGTSWQFIDNTTTPAITGIATTEFDNIHLHARKLWFVQKNSMSVWYLPTNQIGGAATEFPLGQVFKLGGKLLAMTSWTVDGGAGPNDLAVFITTEGELAVYQGTDPSSASTWVLVGVFYVGEPVGKKCFIKYGGDVLLITQTGLYPLSKALQSSTISRVVAVSNKIDYTFSAAASAYGANFGWSGEVFPSENILLVNIPEYEGEISKQFVMNTITGAWCLYSNWNAFCWEIWDENIYFGGKQSVSKAFSGADDYGTAISANCQMAYNYFKYFGNKKWNLLRPILKVSGNITISVGLDVDFSSKPLLTSASLVNKIPARWDASDIKWDSAEWQVDEFIKKDWITTPAKEGFCAALRLQISAKSVTVKWSATDFIFEKGSMF